MDVRGEIEELVEIGGRWPGTDPERRAARHLEHRLEELGRDVEVESIEVWPSWPLANAIHALIAIVGSVISVSVPVLGFALVLAATVLAFGDATGLFPTTRRLLGRRASQNVISREDGDKGGALVLVAHYDSGRTGAAFGRWVQERRAALGQRIRRPIGSFEPFFWTLVVLLVCCLIRVFAIEGIVLTLIQFVPTVALIAAVPLFVDIALSGAVPGANDNASGVATVLALADRFGGKLEHFDVWVLLTGAQEGFALGSRAFLRRHRDELDSERTVFVNVDEVGAGTIRYTSREGVLITLRSHPQLLELCDDIREDDEEENVFAARPLVARSLSDAYAIRSAGLPAITITCRNALGYTPDHHLPTDRADRIDDTALERAQGFLAELIERLDAEIGPHLERGRETTALEEERSPVVSGRGGESPLQ
jgi:hypothetical protein